MIPNEGSNNEFWHECNFTKSHCFGNLVKKRATQLQMFLSDYDGEIFNHFDVTPDRPEYETTNLRYSARDVDRLRELMRHNIGVNIEVNTRNNDTLCSLWLIASYTRPYYGLIGPRDENRPSFSSF